MLKTKIVLACTGVLIALLMQGCGRKGPLFMSQPASAPPVPAVVKVQSASAVVPSAPAQNITPSN